MAFPPTSSGSLDIENLLEREEKKAKDRVRQQQEKNGNTHNDSSDQQMGGMGSHSPGSEFRTAMQRELDARRAEDPVFDAPNRKTDRSNRDDVRSSRDRYLTEREENDERRARRSRDHVDDNAATAGSDKDSANGSVRSRRRSRSPRSDSRRDHRSRERTGDYYDGGGRSSGDRGYRADYRDRDRDRRNDRPRSRDRGGRDRHRDDRDRYRGGRERGGRDSNRRSPGGPRNKTPEPTDDERDRRTVFVQQLAARLRSRELKEFFQQAGPVVDAQIVKDRVSGRSKGVGYVEFKEEDSVQKAIQLTGQKLLGIPIIAQLTEAEKNRQARNTEGVPTQSNGVPFHRLYVGNIHFSITEDDLKNVFEPFGELEFVQLQKEEAGRSKGYGFVQFIDPTQAKEALEKMNGFELAGRPIRVGLGNDKFTPESTQSLLQRFGNQAHNPGASFSGMGGRGAHAGGTGNFDRPAPRDVDKTGGASALDDTDVGGVNFNNYSRDSLMRKLARTDEPEQKVTTTTQPQKPVISAPTPTRCIIVKHMYDQAEETEDNWQEELVEDVREECNKSYGLTVHVGLALDSNDGEVYIKFNDVKGAEAAMRGLNGRSFQYRMLTATYVVDAVYNMNFPKAAKL